MKFRDFVEVTRDALESVAFRMEGERDITPMLHLEAEHAGITIIGIDPEYFQSARNIKTLVTGYVVPLIAENQARKVAWSYCVWVSPNGGPRPSEHPERREMLLATFIDPEVVEHWATAIVRTGGPVLLGPWEDSIPNTGGGPLTTTIQEALR